MHLLAYQIVIVSNKTHSHIRPWWFLLYHHHLESKTWNKNQSKWFFVSLFVLGFTLPTSFNGITYMSDLFYFKLCFWSRRPIEPFSYWQIELKTSCQDCSMLVGRVFIFFSFTVFYWIKKTFWQFVWSLRRIFIDRLTTTTITLTDLS